MAGIKLNQRSAVPKPSVTGGRQRPSKVSLVVLISSILVALWAASMLTRAGRIAYVHIFFVVDFFAGVFALVSLSISIMLGLVATDRIVLQPPHRVLVQAAHRTTGVLAVAFLVLHILTQISLKRVGALDVLIPFIGSLYVGYGSLAAIMMVGVLATGAFRSFFLGGKPWVWRALHSIGYLSWPIALVHGLNAGRPAKGWVVGSYLACVGMVAVGLLVRFYLNYGRRTPFTGSVATGAQSSAALAAEPTATTTRSARRRSADVRVEPADAFATGRGRAHVADSWVADDSWSSPGDYRRREAGAPPRPGRYRVPPVPRADYDEDDEPMDTRRRASRASSRPTVAARGSGRHSRDDYGPELDDPGYLGRDDYLPPPDDTPTLVDLAARRARRAESAAPVSRARRRRRAAGDDDLDYWSQLRGEAR